MGISLNVRPTPLILRGEKVARRVIDPRTGNPIPAAGARVPHIQYWLRLLSTGQVELIPESEPTPAPAPAPAPAREPAPKPKPSKRKAKE